MYGRKNMSFNNRSKLFRIRFHLIVGYQVVDVLNSVLGKFALVAVTSTIMKLTQLICPAVIILKGDSYLKANIYQLWSQHNQV